ncbi:MAG: B12-binding domain-containing radical SAM protein [Armatimonadota bacterium]
MYDKRILILEPPRPKFINVLRDYAGGYGIATKTSRTDYGHEGASAPFLSAFYIAGLLEQSGFDTYMIDCPAERLNGEESLKRIRECNPQIIVSVVSLPSMDGDLNFLDMIGEQLPSVKIVAIGTVCKLLYDKILDQHNVVAAVRDNNEMIVPELISAILNKTSLSEVPGIAYRIPNQQTCLTENSTQPDNLDYLPIPPYHKLPIDSLHQSFWDENVKYMPIMQEKGCPYPCRSFCPYPFGFGRFPIYRSPKLIVDEIQLLNDQFSIEAFYFSSQNFLMNRQHAQDICVDIIHRELKIRWVCEARLDSVDPEILHFMKSAGCEQIHFGLESGDAEMFAGIGKPGSNLSIHGRAVAQSKEAGLMVKLMVIVGLPGETWTTVNNTIKTIRKLKPDVVQAAILCPYPGTAVFEDAKRKGLLLTEDWSSYTGYDPVMRTEGLSIEDIREAQIKVQNSLTKSIFSRVMKKAYKIVKRDFTKLKQII